MVVFDVQHVFRVFGGPAGVLTALNRHEPVNSLNYNTVQMWLHRKQIPAKWIGLVLYAVEQDGHSCAEFLVDTDELGGKEDVREL